MKAKLKDFYEIFKESDGLEKILICSMVFVIFILIILIIVPTTYTIVKYQNKETHIVTVEEKYNKVNSDSASFYIIGNDGDKTQVFLNHDLLFKGRFNSADEQAKVKTGKKYEVKTIGYRIEFFSIYKEIYSIKEIK